MASHLLYKVVPCELLHLRLHPGLGLVAGLGTVQRLPATVLEDMAPGGEEALQGVPHLNRVLGVRAVTQAVWRDLEQAQLQVGRAGVGDGAVSQVGSGDVIFSKEEAPRGRTTLKYQL